MSRLSFTTLISGTHRYATFECAGIVGSEGPQTKEYDTWWDYSIVSDRGHCGRVVYQPALRKYRGWKQQRALTQAKAFLAKKILPDGVDNRAALIMVAIRWKDLNAACDAD